METSCFIENFETRKQAPIGSSGLLGVCEPSDCDQYGHTIWGKLAGPGPRNHSAARQYKVNGCLWLALMLGTCRSITSDLIRTVRVFKYVKKSVSQTGSPVCRRPYSYRVFEAFRRRKQCKNGLGKRGHKFCRPDPIGVDRP